MAHGVGLLLVGMVAGDIDLVGGVLRPELEKHSINLNCDLMFSVDTCINRLFYICIHCSHLRFKWLFISTMLIIKLVKTLSYEKC